jgi:hypothetical protein
LFEDLLYPSRNVDQAFRSTLFSMTDGRAVAGLVLREEPGVTVIADAQGKEIRLRNDEIAEKRKSPLSPMPADFVDKVDPIEFDHLMAYLLTQRAKPAAGSAESKLKLSWEKNWLTISGGRIAGGDLKIHYLEAYCRSGSTNQKWEKTCFTHKTTAIASEPNRIALRCEVDAGVVVEHELVAGIDDVTIRIKAKNSSDRFCDVQWAQPCARVDSFTGLDQDDYFKRCFIYLDHRPTMLDQTRRTDKALYVPGQVYVPSGVNRADVNPRPLSPDLPSENLIGCYSADGKQIFAMAFDSTQELFQGVGVCIHADFRIGGLKPGESKSIFGKCYVFDGDAKTLLARFRREFGVEKE